MLVLVLVSVFVPVLFERFCWHARIRLYMHGKGCIGDGGRKGMKYLR